MEVLARRPRPAGPRRRRADGRVLRRRRAGVPGRAPARRSSPPSRRRGSCPRCSDRGWPRSSPTCGAGAGSSSARSPSSSLAARPAVAPALRGLTRARRGHRHARVAAVVGGPRQPWRCSSLELLGSARGVAALGALAALAGVWISPRPAAPARQPHPAPRPAVRGRHPRPARRDVLLRRGLHRLRPAGALGPLPRPGRHRADLRRRGVGERQPGPGAARRSGRPTLARWWSARLWCSPASTALAATSCCAHDAGAHPSAVLPAAAYVLAGAGMGFAYPRTGVAMLEVSTDRGPGLQLLRPLGRRLARRRARALGGGMRRSPSPSGRTSTRSSPSSPSPSLAAVLGRARRLAHPVQA